MNSTPTFENIKMVRTVKMTFLPLLMDQGRYDRLRDHFPFTMSPEDVLAMLPQLPLTSLRARKHVVTAVRDSGATVTVSKDKFQIDLRLCDFLPEEVSVKTIDGYLVVEACHEERQDAHGFVSRQFKRRYPLPEECKIEAVESRLSSDGYLTVTAPMSRPAVNERVVPIVQTGAPKPRPNEAKKKEEAGESAEKEPEKDTVENGQ